MNPFLPIYNKNGISYFRLFLHYQLSINEVICFNAINIQIHGFCDSSEQAYGACLYIRSTDSNNKTSCELLCSTSKVAPLKQLTIPRLELCCNIAG